VQNHFAGKDLSLIWLTKNWITNIWFTKTIAMVPSHIIDTITAIQVETPSAKIIRQLKQLILSGQLKPGDRLPAERILAEKFGVGRSYVREAIMKLEIFGLLKTSPQSGTYVSGYNIKILDSLISEVINLNKDDFSALIEARFHLELNSVKMAAQRRTDADIAEMEAAIVEHEKKVANGLPAFEEDLVFHIKIASATKNSVFESMMLIIVPDIIRNVTERKVCGDDRSFRAIKEHKVILETIVAGDVENAEKAMAAHLDEIMQVSRSGNLPSNHNYII
jgi:GntR family transcriptional regulator, transcriptional repressor for pyruvate dehydrogenase complex